MIPSQTSFLSVILLSLLAGVLIHQASRLFMEGKAGADAGCMVSVIAMAIWATPSWLGAAAALMGHFASYAFCYRKDKQEVSFAVGFIGLGMLVMLIGFPVQTNVLTTRAANAIRTAQDDAWTAFAKRGDAYAYAAENYRPCISAPYPQSSSPAAICEAAVVTNATTQKGSEFAKQVSAAIAESKLMRPSAEADKAWKALMDWKSRT